ncbi:MAG TPA: polysaccharide pyruvyl transferase family protein [Candidatus Erysipelatoclostridium merdavium]|uniref:Polysaccharide pyruvyl transferase family protein n=1 Tax=Candidatus Erysipelatoclostridium merdavium TaxID=2838566 RepID=A0A9D1XP38_9FIRM|nr:polysaccharide pyruvyl transferase family protein [Candidatus Erysipelatoclostridium merdavium]
MKKIFLYAYDKVNLGDDLFICSIVERYPNAKFYMISDRTNKENFCDLKNLKIIDKNSNLLRKIRKILDGAYSRYEAFLKKRCDVVVYIGGSIFIEYLTWANIVNWWEYQASQYQLYIIGANFGPYQTEEYKIAMKNVFNKAQDICFRDNNSYNLFKEISKVRFAPDIIFSQTLKEQKSRKMIFVSVINCKNKDEGNHSLIFYHNNYIEVLERIIKDYLIDGYNITLCSFCEAEGDEEVIEELLKRINDKKVKSLLYNGKNRMDILNEISKSCYVIGTRFHSIVLGMIAKKPVFPIVYSKKTRNMLNDIDYKGNYIDIKNIDKLEYKYSKENLDKNYVVDITKLQKESLKHFSRLDMVINSENYN